MTPHAVDSSVVLAAVVADVDGRTDPAAEAALAGAALPAHARVECYSVLTRLPQPLRVTPADAEALLAELFDAAHTLVLPAKHQRELVADLARVGVAGGAAYHGVIALTALAHGLPLLTRDARARPTYERVGVAFTTL